MRIATWRRPLAGLSRVALVATVLVLGSLACSKKHRDPISPDPEPGPGSGPVDLELELVGDQFDFPLLLTAPPGDHTRLFVAQKGGLIRIVKNDVLLPTPFLNLTGQVSAGEEQGLLAMAFDPDYAANGRFYVSYTDLAGDSKIARYQRSADPDLAVPVGEVVLTVDQTDPYDNHNGGMIAFGPDGMLHFGMGDGGGAGHPLMTGQDRTDLLGSMVRVDVTSSGPYRVPADNPFSAPSAPEVWSYGLRNPWRFSFDRATGDLYIADVGQYEVEEVNVATSSTGRGKGANYGWSVLEGSACYDAPTCDRTGKVLPTLEYDHSLGCSVTGGYVYRGAAIPALRGTYFYADYCGGWVRSFRFSAGQATEQRVWDSPDTHDYVVSFGEDASGELYVLTASGKVYRIVQSG
jgi:hypothetical protein